MGQDRKPLFTQLDVLFEAREMQKLELRREEGALKRSTADEAIRQ